MNRLNALRIIDRVMNRDPLVLTCGATAREFASLGLGDNRLPLLDSMGLTSAVGLGVALAYPGPVGIVDGDGSLLMGFSILPTLATVRPKNLTLILLDNRQHASADEMPSQSAEIDLAKAIRGCGIPVTEVSRVDELETALTADRERDELSAILAHIDPGNTPGIPLLLEDPAAIAHRFGEAIRVGR